MPENIVANPISKPGAEAVLLERWGAGKPKIEAAQRKAPETVLADAMEHATSGQEAYKLIERGSRPKDHHEEIEDLSGKMGLKRNEKTGKIEQPVPGTSEAKRREQFAERANLLNEYQQKGFDGIGDGKDPDNPADKLDKPNRQAYLVKQCRQAMLEDPNYAETFGRLPQDKQDKYITEQLRTNYKKMAGKIETYLTPRLQNADFISVDTDKAFFDDRTAQRAIKDAGEPGRQIDDKIKDKIAEIKDLENMYKDDVDEARTHRLEDKKIIRDISSELNDLYSKFDAAAAAPKRDLHMMNDLATRIDEVQNRPGVKNATNRLGLVEEYDKQTAQYNTEIRQLESDKRTAALKIEEAKDHQIQTHDSLERMQEERAYREQQSADRIISDTLGQAFMDLEYEANEAQMAAVSARIPIEEQELAARRTEVQRATVAGANDYLDDRWKRSRRIPGITQAKEWKNRAERSIIEKWDSLTDPERERFESASEKTTRLELIEDDYQRTINLDGGVDRVMRNLVTSIPGGAGGGNKTFAELSDAISDEKDLKDMLRNAALRHIVDIRHELSAELGRKTDEPPRQVTEADRKKIVSRSWIDKGVLDGIQTDQGLKALSEANPNILGDIPVSRETIDKAKAGDKAALETVKQKMKVNPSVFLLVLGLSSAEISMGSTMLHEDQKRPETP
jgi:hypothetical protein